MSNIALLLTVDDEDGKERISSKLSNGFPKKYPKDSKRVLNGDLGAEADISSDIFSADNDGEVRPTATASHVVRRKFDASSSCNGGEKNLDNLYFRNSIHEVQF